MSNIFRYITFRHICNQKIKVLNSVIKCSQHKINLCTRTFVSQPKKNGYVKPSRFKRAKKMLREYWYVAIPVHVIDSVVWFGCCYYVNMRGFNILKLLRKLGVREDIINFLADSNMGQLTLTLALYKVIVPIRIVTTVVLSAITVRYFSRIGLIRPARNPFKRKKKKSKENSENKEC